MASSTKLCSTCSAALKTGLEQSDKHLCTDLDHHATLDCLLEAVAGQCFICTIIWKSFSEETRSGWTSGTVDWGLVHCSLQRRLWLEPPYLQCVYLELHLSTKGGRPQEVSFCLRPSRSDDNRSSLCAEIGNDTSSQKALDLAYDWYKSCCASNGPCNQLANRSKFVPNRLLDVGADGDTICKLRSLKDYADQQPDYMTLSYRWDESPKHILLLKSNIETLRQGISIVDLPRTFCEAITVTRHFSVRFIWIDSLCILQDSVEDWEKESANMHEIYTHSSCNIAASASSGPNGGLFRSRCANDILPGFITIDVPHSDPMSFLIWDEQYARRHLSGPLDHRGWVFQERILAPRVIHFTESQICWECFTEERCEAFRSQIPFPTGLPTHLPLKTFDALLDPENSSVRARGSGAPFRHRQMSEAAFLQWSNLVEHYTECMFTKLDDRLVAFSGLANLFRDMTNDDYLAGIWRSWLLEGLCWGVTKQAARPSNTSRAPSWSWACLDSPVGVRRCLPGDNFHATILEAEIFASNGSARAMSGFIKLKGCITEAVICEDISEDHSFKFIAETGNSSTVLSVIPDYSDFSCDKGTALFCLAFRSYALMLCDEDAAPELEVFMEGFILEPVLGATATFRRIGVFRVKGKEGHRCFGLRTFNRFGGDEDPELAAALSEDAQVSTITII